MEFRQAFDTWRLAHQAAHEAECQALRLGATPASAQERQRAMALRRQASQKLRAMLAASAAAAAACRPDPQADDAQASPVRHGGR